MEILNNMANHAWLFVVIALLIIILARCVEALILNRQKIGRQADTRLRDQGSSGTADGSWGGSDFGSSRSQHGIHRDERDSDSFFGGKPGHHGSKDNDSDNGGSDGGGDGGGGGGD